MSFRDRVEAGRQLAVVLRTYQDRRPFVLGIPRGGVVVAYEVALALDAPLDVTVPRKLRAPQNPELAVGAVAHDGSVYLDEELVRSLRITDEYLREERVAQLDEIQRRMRLYRGDRPMPDLTSHAALVIDDGIATGSTMIAALRATRAMRPEVVIAAIPVAPPDGIRRLRAEADEVYCLLMPEFFYAVGQFYDNFDQTTDDEVTEFLRQRAGPHPRPETKRGDRWNSLQ